MNYYYLNQQHKLKNVFIISNYVMQLDISAMALAIYFYLMYIEDRKTYQCYPSYKTIGSAVGLSKNTVKKHIDGLVAKQLIITEPTTVITKKGQKHNGTLLYTIRPIQEAVECRYQQQLMHFQAEMCRQKALARIEKLYGDQGSRKKREKA